MNIRLKAVDNLLIKRYYLKNKIKLNSLIPIFHRLINNKMDLYKIDY